MRLLLPITCILAISLVARADAPTDDAQAMQGTWTPTTAELGGQAMPDALLKSISLKLDKDHYEAHVGDKSDKGTYTLDTASEPKGMSITGTEGPNRGKTFLAIYQLDGDTLRVCYELSGEKRPSEFKTSKGTTLYLVTYSRKKE